MKNYAKVLFVAVLFFIFLGPSFSFAAEGEEVDIQSYVKEMQPGWNLGNSFDAVGLDETAWGNPPVTKELIDTLAAEGYKSIRIPITFDQRMGVGPDYQIDPAFLERVTNTVNWSLDADMKVMINIHHDSWIWLESGMSQNHDASLARYNAIWTQLSNHFKDYSTDLMFESINEPRFTASATESQNYLNELNTSFYTIVRGSGGNNSIRPLVLPTLDTGSEQEKLDGLYQSIVALDDPYLISTVHYYGFWPFSVNIAGYTRFDDDTKNDIINTFDRVHNTFTANGIPVIIGEFGLLGFDTHTGVIQQGEKLKYFEYMMHYAQEKDFTHMLWDNGQHLGRTSLEWADQQLFNMMEASWMTRSSTAENDFIYLNRLDTIEDEPLPLNLNGNTFISLQLNNTELTLGQDYQLDGDILIVKESLLTQLTASDELGTNAVLTIKFSQGADWSINLISYEKPVLEDSTGSISDFAIPTSFNGDQLATVETVYQDGTPAGPQNWTTFKEFGYTFSPSYDSNEILFTENFFNELNNGETKVTFHFWSGEEVYYTLTKEDNTITGVAEAIESDADHDLQDNELPQEEEEENTVPPKTIDNETPDPTTDETDKDSSSSTESSGNTSSENTKNTVFDKTESEFPVPLVNDNSSVDEKEVKKMGAILPNTATNMFNWLFISILFLGSGIGIYFYQRNHKQA
ncbi:cellulase family glycosylhydrolase [Paraliobacillus zengyii]|uniref:cellulase family glycosylhydrolase n=1 Tax=Paraliobacillus zengyii TaxID=2213194 RepID=UPI001F544B35|nr:cellulase family glycosylhydrolase [Paraliobacillus zengyii]